MGFMASGGGFNDGNDSHWSDQKHTIFLRITHLDDTNWETADVCMSVPLEAIRKSTGRVNASLECWGCTNSPRYHTGMFHAYRKSPNKRYPDVVEHEK